MVPAQNPMDNPTYRVRYLGEVFVGSSGGVDKIEEGVSGWIKRLYALLSADGHCRWDLILQCHLFALAGRHGATRVSRDKQSRHYALG